MLGDSHGEEISAVHVDTPKLAHPVNWIVNGVKVFCESGRGYKTINLLVGVENLANALVYRLWL